MKSRPADQARRGARATADEGALDLASILELLQDLPEDEGFSNTGTAGDEDVAPLAHGIQHQLLLVREHLLRGACACHLQLRPPRDLRLFKVARKLHVAAGACERMLLRPVVVVAALLAGRAAGSAAPAPAGAAPAKGGADAPPLRVDDGGIIEVSLDEGDSLVALASCVVGATGAAAGRRKLLATSPLLDRLSSHVVFMIVSSFDNLIYISLKVKSTVIYPYRCHAHSISL